MIKQKQETNNFSIKNIQNPKPELCRDDSRIVPRCKTIGLLFVLFFIATAPLRAQEDVSVSIEEDTVYTDEQGDSEIVEELPPIEKLPEVTTFVNAEYPETALKAGLEGPVNLQLIISDSGMVDSVTVLKGLSPEMDSAAVKAVRQFIFSPAIAGGQAIPVAIEYQYRFSLQEIVKDIQEYVNFKGAVREKGTRNPVGDGMVVVTFLDTTMDNNIKVPFSAYLNKIGGFEGQYLEENKLVTVTNSKGQFEFKSLPACSISISFPISGYNMKQFTEVIEPGKQVEMEYRLRRESYDEYEIVVYGKAEKKEVAKKTLTVSEIKKMPGFGGDAIKVVQALPGVARPSFISGDIIIRGSGNEDTRFFLDGVDVPRIYHFGGIRAVYSSELLSSIDMYPGGFNSRYGGAVGGIVEIKGRSAKTDRWHGNVDVNLLDAGLMLEGPVGENLALQVAGRYSYIGEFVCVMTKDAPMTVVPYYWDGLVRLDWNINKTDRMFLTYASSKDDMEIITSMARGGSEENTDDTELAFESELYQMIIFGYDKQIDKELKNELRLSYKHEKMHGNIFGFTWWDMAANGMYVRDELTYAPNSFMKARGGLDMEASRFDYEMNIMGAKGYLGQKEQQYFSILGGYGNIEFYLMENLMVMPGIRWDYYADVEEGHPSYRLTSRWEYIDNLTLKGAAGTYSQVPKPVGQATDEMWGNPDLPATKAKQIVAGHEWQINDLVSLDVQTYYNTQTDVPNYTDSTNPETGRQYNFLPDMEARMYGMEIMLRHDQGKRFFGWISYSLSRSERRAPNAFSEGNANVQDWDPDKWVLSEYDQTHNIQVLGSWRLPWNFETGFRFRYVTGNPMTPLLSFTENKYKFDSDEQQYVAQQGKAFSDRMGPFMQLDVRLDKKFVFNSWILTSYLDFQNVNYFFYNSPELYSYNYDGSKREPIGSIFLPSVGISAEF
ncbi:MAG: TonB family protein [Fibrobacteria bacterium]|nr:TonB family protein [Fibrobacteria bacterium]